MSETPTSANFGPDGKPFNYRAMAEEFVRLMQTVAPELRLDYSMESVEALELWILARVDTDPAKGGSSKMLLIMGVGSYVGEVIIRAVGGRWNPSGAPEINDVGPVAQIFPIAKVRKRFENGPQDNIDNFLRVVLQEARC